MSRQQGRDVGGSEVMVAGRQDKQDCLFRQGGEPGVGTASQLDGLSRPSVCRWNKGGRCVNSGERGGPELHTHGLSLQGVIESSVQGAAGGTRAA